MSNESNRDVNEDYLKNLKYGDDYKKEHKKIDSEEQVSKESNFEGNKEQKEAEQKYEKQKEQQHNEKQKYDKQKVKEAKQKQKHENKKYEYFVGFQKFISAVSKPGEQMYLSKVNKPAKIKDNPNFIGKLLFQFSKDNTTGMAAQLAHYFLLAVFPALIFLLTIIPYFNIEHTELTDMVNQYMPSEISGMINNILSDVLSSSSGGLLSIGLILTLWSASNGMNQLMSAFNVAYDIEDNRNGILSRLLSIVFTLLLAFAIVGTFILMVLGNQIGNFMFGAIGFDEEFSWIWNLVRNLLPVILVFISFLTVYSFAPNLKVKFKSVIPGTIFSTVVFIVASLGFSYYVSNFGNYSATYGSIAGVIILIFWLYIMSIVLILGAQINAIKHKELLNINGRKGSQKVEKP